MKLLSLLLFTSISASALQEDTKGLLPEVQLTPNNEELNMKKSFDSEVLITKSENKAIESLKKIINKNRKTREEPDLLFRLAELYMRRAKSGRFFDLDQNSEYRLKQIGLPTQKAQTALKDAIKVYDEIRLRFPNYSDLDFVLFNSALANIQIKEVEKAKKLYTQLITNYPKSTIIPDALLELGELYYNQQNFNQALEKFLALEKYPDSRAYPYGLYKSAWCFYNLKNTEQGINKLLMVVQQNPHDTQNTKKYNLRREALRDLTLFVGETLPSKEIFSFFQDITTEGELGEIMMALAGLYESHSRFKEISVFTRQYIEHYPKSPQAVSCYTKLIETNETLKLRPIVIENLTEMSEFCKKNKNESCMTEFRKVSLEISKKWWDIWLKNKSNSEFSNLTEKAFRNLLSVENPESPDSKSRYAFAELLFQQEKFEEASLNYETVSLQKNLDKTLSHDSLYGALYSIEKILEKKDSSDFVEKQKALAQRYLKEFTNGEHLIEIQYKLGFIYYKQANYNEALKYIKPLLAQNKYDKIKTKAEDLILDIYNIQKDYVTLQKTALVITKSTTARDRLTNLKRIAEEAQYSQMQIDLKTKPVKDQITLLNGFAKEHNDSKLGQDANWQSVSLAFSNGYDVLGADLSLDYIKQYPQDNRKADALKDAVKAYLDSGNIVAAISTLKSLNELNPAQSNENTALLCDLLNINNQLDESRQCYKKILSNTDKDKKAPLLSKIIKTFEKETDSKEYREIQNLILSENIEPLATNSLIKKARALLQQNNKTEAFNLSMKINARPVDADLRAEARLIQAEILESEFTAQSVKAQENKFAMVLAIKTEKFDKAFTAYSSAIKMSKTDKIQKEALLGINRLYANFIDSLNNMPMPNTLSPEDQKNLKSELAKITAPFEEKKKANFEEIKKLSIPVETTKYPVANRFKNYFSDVVAFNQINQLIQKKMLSDAEKASLTMTATNETRQLGLYYLSIIADIKKEYDKSLWLLERAEMQPKSNPDSLELINYEKAKVLFTVEDINTSLKYFEKVLNKKNQFAEVSIIKSIMYFSDGDYLKAHEEISRLSKDQIYNYDVGWLKNKIELVINKNNQITSNVGGQ